MRGWTDEQDIRWWDHEGSKEMETSHVEEWVKECVAKVKAGYLSYGIASGDRAVRAAWHWEDGDIVIEVGRPLLTGRLAWNRPEGLKSPEEA